MNYSDESVEAARTAGVEVDNAGLAVMTVLRNYGIDTVFGIPGTHNLELYRPLTRLGIHAVTSRHEQGAGYGADGWSQQTGLPGVVITTSGPGMLNALSAVGTAYCESRPLIVISPGVAEGDEFADNGSLHETKDSTGAAGAIAEWSRRVRSASEAVQAVHDAFELFRYSRPRPVHIEIPLNALESASDAPVEHLAAVPLRAKAVAAQADLDQAIAVLRGAERPVIVAGGGASRIGSQLTMLAERLSSPVVTTINGKAAISEKHPLSLASDIRLPSVLEVVNTSDAVLIIGSKLGEAELWGGVVAPAGTVIRIDVLDTQMQKNVSSDISLLGDSGTIVAGLVDGLSENQPVHRADLAKTLTEVRRRAREEAREISPVLYSLSELITAALPDDAIVGGDSSQITYLGMASVLRQRRPHSFLYTPAYATLGYGLPASIGAKIASPDRPVVCVLGDGALMFSVQEFATAVEQGLDLTVICVDSGGYGEIEQNERDRGIQPVGVILTQPDWAALADAFGGTGYTVGSPDEVTAVVARAIAAPGLNVVHIPLDIFDLLTGT